MNTILLYITLAFFVVVVATLVIMLVGASQARADADSEIERRRVDRNPPTGPSPRQRLG